MLTGMTLNFLQIPENIPSLRTGWNVPCHAWVNQVCSDCRESWTLALECLNDMFKQQQAKNQKEVVHKTVETACKVQQKKIEWTIKQ